MGFGPRLLRRSCVGILTLLYAVGEDCVVVGLGGRGGLGENLLQRFALGEATLFGAGVAGVLVTDAYERAGL